MADIITGKGLALQYNIDTGNRSPQGIGNVTVNEINTFPVLTINSEKNTFDTYDSEYNTVLLSDKTVEPFQIVVNYLPDDSTHMFLDEMADSQGYFQCIIQYEFNMDESAMTYAIVNGYITSTQLSGDKDSVVTKSYTFTPQDVVARMSTMAALLPIYQGDYGVGSNTTDIPQYAPTVPTGNSFIKVPSTQEGNPAGADMMGFGLVDGTSVAEFAMTKTGTLSLFAKNATTAWTRIYTATQMDARYVPLTRTINGYALTANVVLNSEDTGSVPDTRKVNGHVLSDDVVLTSSDTGSVPDTRKVNGHLLNEDVVLTSTDTGSVPDTRTVNGKALSDDVVITSTDVGLGKVTDDTQLTIAGNLSDLDDVEEARINLAVYSKGEVDAEVRDLADSITTLDSASMKKANNLSDLPSLSVARTNLQVNRLTQGATYTDLMSNDLANRIRIQNNGAWGASTGTGWIALGIGQGGTGVTTQAGLWGVVRPSGTTPLAADPVSAYDATTKRYVDNLVGAGTTGPTMNGVMNFGVGQVTPWASRAYIPAYCLPLDGQLVNRADWPELWTHAQQHSAIDDSVWISDKTQRGKYSTGDGKSTFRLPDLNGVQTKGTNGFTGDDSVRALFVRGDGGGGISAGMVSPSGAPNITGNFDLRRTTSENSGGGDYSPILATGGIFSNSTLDSGSIGAIGPIALSSNSQTRFLRVSLDASKSSSVYGGTTTELRPNNFSSVWIVRASGGFVATNTQWDVINGDSTTPANATYVTGGRVRSTYNIGTSTEISGGFRTGKTMGQTGQADLTLFVSENGAADKLWGLKGPSGAILTDVQSGWMTNTAVSGPTDANSITFNGMYAGPGDSGINYSEKYSPLLHMQRYPGANRSQLQIDGGGTLRVRGGNGTTWFAWLIMQAQGTSGREYKHDINLADPNEALNRINSLELVNFIYNDDEQERVRFGIIAEDAEQIAPQYIKHDEETVEDDNGNVITRDHPRIDINPIVMDLLGAIQAQQEEINQLKDLVQSLLDNK